MHAQLRAVTMCASWPIKSDRSFLCNHLPLEVHIWGICPISLACFTNLTWFKHITRQIIFMSKQTHVQRSLWKIFDIKWSWGRRIRILPLWYVVAGPVICRQWAALPIPSFAEARLMYRPMAHGAGYVWPADHPNIWSPGIWEHHLWIKRDKRQPFRTLILQYPFSQQPLPNPCLNRLLSQ